jgi:endonuclease YncB( thermonuclease family)
MIRSLLILLFAALFAGCSLDAVETGNSAPDSVNRGDLYTVTRIIDGDTIEVRQGEVTYRVRYVGVNTPERGEPCYADARAANIALVEGKQVTLERDQSNTDRYGRLLRYVYVDSTFVNRELVRNGWAEAVLYRPDDRHYDEFLRLEREAANAGRGCHPTGIFDDGSDTR